MHINAVQGVRFATGSPFAAALNAKSGATKAAPAKAANAPAKAFATAVAPAAAVTSAKKRLRLARRSRPPTKGTPLWH